MAVKSKAVTHIDIAVTNLEQAAAFYGKLLGWTFTKAMDGYWFWQGGASCGGLNLVPKKKLKGNSVTLYFTVTDISKMLAKAQALGGSILAEKEVLPGGYGAIGTVADPFGNAVGFWSKK